MSHSVHNPGNKRKSRSICFVFLLKLCRKSHDYDPGTGSCSTVCAYKSSDCHREKRNTFSSVFMSQTALDSKPLSIYLRKTRPTRVAAMNSDNSINDGSLDNTYIHTHMFIHLGNDWVQAQELRSSKHILVKVTSQNQHVKPRPMDSKTNMLCVTVLTASYFHMLCVQCLSFSR